MWEYNYTDELYHYGVLGMKWGHRKARNEAIRKAKLARKKRDARIQDNYWKNLESIERNYKKGQTLSKKDLNRESSLDNKAERDWAKSKAQMKSEIAKAKAEYKKNVPTSTKKKVAIGSAAAAAGLAAIGGAYLYSKKKNGSGFSISELRDMGIATFSPDTFKIR